MSEGPSTPLGGGTDDRAEPQPRTGTDGITDGGSPGASGTGEPAPGQGRSRSSRRRRNRRARQRAERAERAVDGGNAGDTGSAGAAGHAAGATPVPGPRSAARPPRSERGSGAKAEKRPDAASDTTSNARSGPRPEPPRTRQPRPTHRLDGSTAKNANGSGKGAKGTKSSGGRRRGARRWMRQVDEFSAGGLVLDLTGDVPLGALIGRTDRQGRLLWSLPKGHIEPGETAEQAAVREVEEETGIAGVILGELGVIDFWFVAEGRRIHKTVRHYLMRQVGGELSDADIEVDEVAWVPLPTMRDRLAYPDERGLVDTAGRMLAESA